MLQNQTSPAVTETTAASAPTAASVEELVRTHLPLVGHLVREVLARVPAHVGRDDLVSAGMYALTVAAQGFDSSLGVAFGAYASIRIRGALADELRSRDWASRSVRGRARELDRVRSELAVTVNRVPTRTEVAAAMGVSPTDVDAIEADVSRASTVSLQSMTTEACDIFVPSTGVQPDELIVRREQVGLLHDAIAELPERMRIVVQDYFFGQRRMLDIAADLGVTESRVSQLRSEALGMLREAMQEASAPTPAPQPADLSARARSRMAARAAYAAAVASRSSLTDRLAATNLLGEPVAVAQ